MEKRWRFPLMYSNISITQLKWRQRESLFQDGETPRVSPVSCFIDSSAEMKIYSGLFALTKFM